MDRLSVHHELDHWVTWTPEKTAVHDGKLQFTYAELGASSSRLSQALRWMGVIHQDRVAFCLSRSVHCLVALLGILKTGAAYVPIDHKSPHERAKSILQDCSPRVIICDATTLSMTRIITESCIPIICLGEPSGNASEQEYEQAWVDHFPAVAPAEEITGDDLAYILYTSGSTGNPKGVMISHANIRSYIGGFVSHLGISSKDRILCTAPFHFDMSTFDVFCTLRTGATLFVASETLMLFPGKLVSFMEQCEVTLWKGISSLLMYVARAGVLRTGRLPLLRAVLFGGEALATRWLIQWMEVFPEKAFFNVYGPTEATGISLFHKIEQLPDGPLDRIPIGRPCNDTYVYLLGEDLRLVPDGEIGELYLGGAGLARGYLNDPEKTSRAFRPDPFQPGKRVFRTGDLARRKPDGAYEFIGRFDHQVKIMGYRVELGEIEHALAAMPGVSDAAVLMLPIGSLDQVELVAFIEGDSAEDPETILEKLKIQIPFYMIPRRMHKVEQLPRCERGKINRKALAVIGNT